MDEERIKAGRDVYDQFIMKELLSQSHVSNKHSYELSLSTSSSSPFNVCDLDITHKYETSGIRMHLIDHQNCCLLLQLAPFGCRLSISAMLT